MRINAAAVSQLIATYLEVPPEVLTPDARFVEDLGADSVGLTDVVLALEEHFDIDIPPDDVPRLSTLGQVLTYLDARGHHATRDG
jgi:acyl carrier protein